MHLLHCLHPKRVYNQYRNEYVWVACRECEACRNARSAKWTYAIERERRQHQYSLFVTLTYDESHLPVLDFGRWCSDVLTSDSVLVPSKGDEINLRYSDFEVLFEKDYDKELFTNLLEYGGIPYCSSLDLQLFLKRLNKYIYANITKKYQNFRYFVCSEYGSTTFRPHFHGIFFIDDSEVAQRFEECIFHSWKQGRIDCQYVQKSAGSYVAQYVNKSASLPLFYKKGKIRQKFYFSRFPTIGDSQQSDSDLQKLIDNPNPTEVCPSYRGDSKFVALPLCSSVENRLFQRCVSYCSFSDSSRIAMYTINSRFNARSFRDLAHKLFDYGKNISPTCEFDFYLCSLVKDYEQVTKRFLDYCRRVYYISKRFLTNCHRFAISVDNLYKRILEYWSKKELLLLKQFYEFQETESKRDETGLVMMYPEFCYQNFGHEEDFKSFIKMFNPIDYKLFCVDSVHLNNSNRLTHFKNAYIDSKILSSDNPFIYKLLKNYFYAKKCYETYQTFAT